MVSEKPAPKDDNKGKLKAQLEVTPAAANPERSADDLVKQGKYADAISAYLNTASKSSAAKAQDVLAKLSLTSQTPTLTTKIGKPFESSFDVHVAYGNQPGAPAAAGIPVKFTYPSKTDGQLGSASQTVMTDAQGFARLTLPVPTFTVRDNVVATIDTSVWPQMASLETPQHDLRLPYAVDSDAKQVPLVVALADLDEKGGLRRQESTSALIDGLQKLGFQASGVQINRSLIKQGRDKVIVTGLKFQGKTSGRAVYGTVSLVSTTAASPFTAEVSGTVKVVDIETGKLVYELKSDKATTAADRASAVAQAFRQWSADAAATFESELP